MSKSVKLAVVRRLGPAFFLIAAGLTLNAQVAVPVGSGSYASFVPAIHQHTDEYYGLGAQQMLDLYPFLHIDSSLTGLPMPSNQWWTDYLMSIKSHSYDPNANPPSVVVQNAFGGQLWSYPVLLSANSTGFNLYYPNAWNTGTPPQGGFNTGPALPVTASVPLTVGANDILIASFNEATYQPGWTTTGTAFGTGPVVGGGNQSPAVQGFLGGACVNSFTLGGDGIQGTLTSPAFTIQKHFIQLLVGGGNDTNNAAVWLVISNNVVLRATGHQSGTLTWNTWDVSAYAGQTAQIKIVDSTSGGWGFVLCSWIVATDDGSDPTARYNGSFSPQQSVVTGWSDWGFQFGLPDGTGRRMDVTLARGVPFVWTTYTGVNPTINIGTTTIYNTNNSTITITGGTNFTATAFAFDYQGRSFGIFAPDNTSFSVSGTKVTAQLSGTTNYLVYGLLPNRTNLNEFAQYAYAKVTGTRMDWDYDRPNGRVKSMWTLTTSPLKNGQTNTLQGWLPHHYRTTQNNLVFKPYTYLTPRGLMKVAAGNQFQVNFPFHGVAPMLTAPRTNGLPNDYVQSWMETYVQNFANAGHPNGDETYGAGKDLGVSAQYMTFASQMGLTGPAAQLKGAIKGKLQDWFTYTPGETHHFFAKYTNWPALVGFDASYGSQAFNDNHFHYGYYMVATALVGMTDPDWLGQYGPMAKLVAKEYANWDRSDTNFPLFRTFDIWEGHSWAGGTSGGGGENQESSSEAMNSWVGIFLMGNALNDDAMTAAGAMGYAMESTAVNEYWQDIYSTNFPATYGKKMNGILTAGGLAFATYFDGDPAWVYGIQMVPQNHWNNYLVRNKAYAFIQFSNMWNDRIIWQPQWSNSVAYAAGNWVKYGGFIWSANNAVAAGQPAPSSSNPDWSLQRNISTSTAQDLGGYLGNYILGWELLFNPDDVAALMAASHATNGPVTSDGTYSGVTYYLTHALRGLGEQDPNYYTSIPTSQVYYNSQTGQRTALIYNATGTTQTATIYSNGIPVSTVDVAPGVLTVRASAQPGTFEPSLSRNLQINWPTAVGNNYKVQWAAAPTNGASTWNDLTAVVAGDGTTNSLFDPLGMDGSRAYRLLEYTTFTVTNLVNGSFESGTGSTAANWTVSGSESPLRINTNSHSGTWAMYLSNTNSLNYQGKGGINFYQNGGSQGATAIVPGLSYTLSFWAQQVFSQGAGVVQNYSIAWLNSGGAQIGDPIGTTFSGGGGFWNQTLVPGLVAPANAVNAKLTFSSTTGGVTNSMQAVWIDDVSLTTSAPGSTNALPVAVQPGWQISWPSANYVSYGLKRAASLGDTNAWTDIGSNYTGTGSTISVFDPVRTNQCNFYRVYAQP